MNSDSKVACDSLERVCELANESDLVVYRAAVDALRKGEREPEVLACMIACVRDANAGGIQYDLIEVCESFPSELYVSELLRALPILKAKAPDWGRFMFQSLLNTKELGSVLAQKFAEQPFAVQETFRAWIDEISDDDPEYLEFRWESK